MTRLSTVMVRVMVTVAVLGLGACEGPAVFPGADKRQNAHLGRVEGSVVVNSTARGNVVVFLYDAARPPPPEGTGRPMAFSVVGKTVVFGNAAATDSGPFTAPFAFSLVAPGSYLLRGFVDTNDDFIPWYGVTADVNTGDVGGAAVDATTHAVRTVVVAEGSPEPTPAVQVPVSFADSARVPVDRPVFEVPGLTTLSLGSTPKVLELDSAAISEGPIHEAAPVFLARLVDDNGDGVPDDSNGDGVPDFWPRVVVRKLADPDSLLLDENDLDKNGIIDATGVDYEHANPSTGATIPADGVPDLVVLAAGFDFTALLPQLLDSTGRVKLTPTPVNKLSLVVRALALDATNPKAPVPLRTLPNGRYAITVIQSTGQTWRVPNELAPPVAQAIGLPQRASQSFVITVP